MNYFLFLIFSIKWTFCFSHKYHSAKSICHSSLFREKCVFLAKEFWGKVHVFVKTRKNPEITFSEPCFFFFQGRPYYLRNSLKINPPGNTLHVQHAERESNVQYSSGKMKS